MLSIRSRYIEKAEIEALRRAMGREAWEPCEVALVTGLRIGDVVALKCEQVTEEGGVYVLSYTASKTGKEGRAVLPPALGRRLAARRGVFLFPGRGKSGHLTRQAVWGRMKRACLQASLAREGVSPHGLRKAFAVALRRDGGLRAVREALQHSNDAVTRLYAYADTVARPGSDEPIRWRDVELLVDYILERLREEA